MNYAIEELRDGLNSAEAHFYPYPFIKSSGIFSKKTYQNLLEGFPELPKFAKFGDTSKNNTAIKIPAVSVFEDTNIDNVWKDLFKFLTSDEIFKVMIGSYSESINLVYPHIGANLDDIEIGISGIDSLDDKDIILDCQFCANTPTHTRSVVRGPHLDNFSLIYTALIYFRSHDDDSLGGNFVVYDTKGKSPKIEGGRSVSRDQVDPFLQVPYAGNNLISFLNTPMSVHGVSERWHAPVERKYVVFNAVARSPLFKVRRKRDYINRIISRL